MMRPAAISAVLLLALACAPAGCRAEKDRPAPAPAAAQPAEPAPASVPEQTLPTLPAEYRSLGQTCRELAPLCAAAGNLAFPTIEAKSWMAAERAATLVKTWDLAHRRAGGKPDQGVPPAIVDLDLIAINAKRLALAAATWDSRAVHQHWAKLAIPARRLGMLPAAPAAAPPEPRPAEPSAAPSP